MATVQGKQIEFDGSGLPTFNASWKGKLFYDTVTNKIYYGDVDSWEPIVTSGNLSAINLDDLNDVTITDPQYGDVIYYDDMGMGWFNIQPINLVSSYINGVSGTLNTKIDNVSGSLHSEIVAVSGYLQAQITGVKYSMQTLTFPSGVILITPSGSHGKLTVWGVAKVGADEVQSTITSSLYTSFTNGGSGYYQCQQIGDTASYLGDQSSPDSDMVFSFNVATTDRNKLQLTVSYVADPIAITNSTVYLMQEWYEV
jgi:hypothetical protein